MVPLYLVAFSGNQMAFSPAMFLKYTFIIRMKHKLWVTTHALKALEKDGVKCECTFESRNADKTVSRDLPRCLHH